MNSTLYLDILYFDETSVCRRLQDNNTRSNWRTSWRGFSSYFLKEKSTSGWVIKTWRSFAVYGVDDGV